MMSRSGVRGVVAAMAAVAVWAGSSAMALDNNAPLQLTPEAGWTAMELWSQADDISGLTDAGYTAKFTFDGTGAYLSGPDALTLLVNHETSQAAISRVELNLTSFQQAIQSKIDSGVTPFPGSIVTAIGYAYDTIYDGTYDAVTNSAPVASGSAAVGAYGNANFYRFCSATSYYPQSFGAGRGFVDTLYLTGEETSDSTGRFYALDTATQTLWEAPDLGGASWENAALVDSGNTTHVALILQEDLGTAPGAPIRLYIGEKNVDANSDGSIDFLERNGLRGGSTYYWTPTDASSTTDLVDGGGTVTGEWAATSAGALLETKLEDIHTNPLNGSQVAFSDQTDGVYRMDLNLVFSGGSLDTANSGATITELINDNLPGGETSASWIDAPDNLTWSADGLIYVQEDGGSLGVWQIDPNDPIASRLRIAVNNSEPSGIFDISSLVGYAPGSVFIASNLSGSVAQLDVLISPNAVAIPEPSAAMLLGLGAFGLMRRRGV